MSPEERPKAIERVREEYARMAESHARGRAEKARTSIADARANALKLDWKTYTPPKPAFFGTRSFRGYDLAELARYIDWTPFFQAWELKGAYPRILQDDKYGEAARHLFDDAQVMLKQLIEEKWLKANAVVGLFPANRIEDDIAIYADERRERPLMVWHNLRQQMARPAKQPNWCLADIVAPAPVKDYLGAFVVTAGIREDEKVKAFEAAHDDYSAILFKALCDRLAEAFAERLHQRVRMEYWAYASEEALTNDELIQEAYRGIRPAPGYPACPEHSEKGPLFDLLNVPENIGVTLTESYAMLPMASVSGFYFSHPDARYFAVAKIDQDQVADYARRKGWDLATAERWLAPNLGYNPA
jgi:5-methyltetrahydrofolate--homocysteine methyltransferase